MADNPLHDHRLRSAEIFVYDKIQTDIPHTRYFHNLWHTTEVVFQCQRLAQHYELTDEDTEILLVSAWFHDTGYCQGEKNHEEESVRIALAFLKDHAVGEGYMQQVRSLILSTKFPPAPASLAEQILCDADLNHLGSPFYKSWASLLRNELAHHGNLHFSDQDWARKNVTFFQAHHYFTRYAQTLWDSQKQENLQQLLSAL